MNPTEALSRMRQVIRLQHKALATEDTYLYWLRRYMTAVHRMPVPLPSEQKVERFLTDLAQKQHVAASTQNQAFNAVLFFSKFPGLGASAGTEAASDWCRAEECCLAE